MIINSFLLIIVLWSAYAAPQRDSPNGRDTSLISSSSVSSTLTPASNYCRVKQCGNAPILKWFDSILCDHGEVAERIKATVLKTVVRKRTVSSNLTFSSIFLIYGMQSYIKFYMPFFYAPIAQRQSTRLITGGSLV